ncbi:outer membrane beta-barrel protein [Bacteroides thetaiotaomicron]|uniref:outer membrane beta-barrel family protein n=1 Tax=Bacteroides thetaiotaomicron TaxID=818 RepID=UPI001C37F378|nr:outer membrane beta-barrel family protein [Bacteroides thetaiotaomicron]MBV4273271.1 outer membrane beta-barrel protein [Bacteroides thetaiotaomicron]
MKFIISAILSLCINNVYAQKITGVITDRDNNPIEFATIVLQTTDSVFLNSAYTDSVGRFSIKTDTLPVIITIQHLMYETYQKKCNTKAIGSIQMNEKSQMLSEVSIIGEYPLVRVIDGKMTYNMSQLLTDKMATSIYDAILKLPGIHIQKGTFQLIGANNVTILINGKKTNMDENQLNNLLKNMPKERIREAEVMYSAPPQYHVRGAVINLVLDNAIYDTQQLQGQINTLYNQGYYKNFQGGVTILYNTPKTLTDFLYSFGYNQVRTGQEIISQHIFNDQVSDINQSDRGYSVKPIHTIRLGNDWLINDKDKITLAYTAEIQPWMRSFNSSNGTYSDSENKKNTDKPVQMHNIALNYTSGVGFSTGIDFTSYKNHTTQHYRERMEGKEDFFDARSKQDIRRLSFYADQSHSLGKGWTLNYGTKFSFASDKSSQIYHSSVSHNWSDYDSDSQLNEYTYDLYAGFSKRFANNLSLNASLTGEYYKHKKIDYRSLFPMMEITYTANPVSVFQLSVSSDKVYPSYWEMQNTTSYLNGYTEIQGNTDLRPAKNYSFQLNYIWKSKYIFTLFANYTDDFFCQIPYQSSDRLMLIYKTLNFNYSAKLGFNMMIPFRISRIFESRFILNGYYDKMKSDHYYDLSFTKNNLAIYTNLDNTFTISSKPNIKAELSGSYISRNIQGPMTINAMYRIDTGIKWTFNRNKAELSLKVNDIFNSWAPKELNLQYQTQNLRMKEVVDSRRISLSFTYRFGDFKPKAHKEVDQSRFGK